jgi:hypothetical protein
MMIGVIRGIEEAMSPLISSGANEMVGEKMLLAQRVRKYGL